MEYRYLVWPDLKLPPINLWALGPWSPTLKTACVGRCRLDPMTQHCTGCHRSLLEIKRAYEDTYV